MAASTSARGTPAADHPKARTTPGGRPRQSSGPRVLDYAVALLPMFLRVQDEHGQPAAEAPRQQQQRPAVAPGCATEGEGARHRAGVGERDRLVPESRSDEQT